MINGVLLFDAVMESLLECPPPKAARQVCDGAFPVTVSSHYGMRDVNLMRSD